MKLTIIDSVDVSILIRRIKDRERNKINKLISKAKKKQKKLDKKNVFSGPSFLKFGGL